VASFTVVLDANVLYPNTVRDLLIRIGQARLVRIRWTDQILHEVFRNLAENRPDIDPAKSERLRVLMNDAIPDVLVTGYEPLIEVLDLPDPDDRHVLAAAIKVGAQMIVTDNLRDFPADRLAKWDIEARSADHFAHAMVDLNPKRVFGIVQQMADARTRPPMDVDDVLAALERGGLVETVAALRSWERGRASAGAAHHDPPRFLPEVTQRGRNLGVAAPLPASPTHGPADGPLGPDLRDPLANRRPGPLRPSTAARSAACARDGSACSCPFCVRRGAGCRRPRRRGRPAAAGPRRRPTPAAPR
jgi:predicted nucleic acid-binding protein